MAEAPGYDVYLSYSRADFEIVQQLQQDLEQEGFKVFSDVTGIAAGADWQDVLTSALSTAAFVAICVGPTGLGDGQLREIEAAQARGAVDPDFRYAAVLLPGVPQELSCRRAAVPAQVAPVARPALRFGHLARPGELGSWNPEELGPPTTAQPKTGRLRRLP